MVRYSNNKDINQLAKKKVREGWSVTFHGSGHLRWEHPDGEAFTSSATPSAPGHVLRKIKKEIRNIERRSGDDVQADKRRQGVATQRSR